jgi:hypothetical protein
MMALDDGLAFDAGQSPDDLGVQPGMPGAAVQVDQQPAGRGEQQWGAKGACQRPGHQQGTGVVAAVTLEDVLLVTEQGAEGRWNVVAAVLAGDDQRRRGRFAHGTCSGLTAEALGWHEVGFTSQDRASARTLRGCRHSIARSGR